MVYNLIEIFLIDLDSDLRYLIGYILESHHRIEHVIRMVKCYYRSMSQMSQDVVYRIHKVDRVDIEYRDNLDYLYKDICLHHQYIFHQVYLDLVELELDLVLAQSKELDYLDLEELGCLE